MTLVAVLGIVLTASVGFATFFSPCTLADAGRAGSVITDSVVLCRVDRWVERDLVALLLGLSGIIAALGILRRTGTAMRVPRLSTLLSASALVGVMTTVAGLLGRSPCIPKGPRQFVCDDFDTAADALYYEPLMGVAGLFVILAVTFTVMSGVGLLRRDAWPRRAPAQRS